jgi:hypothetical protein
LGFPSLPYLLAITRIATPQLHFTLSLDNFNHM